MSYFPLWLALLLGLALPECGHAREVRQELDAPDTVETPEKPVEKSLAFSPEERRRLTELRDWLRRRSQWRKQMGETGGRAGVPSPSLDEYETYAAGKPGVKSGKPILHISRGPDGRIRHRLIFREGKPDELQTDEPLFDAPDSLESVTNKPRQPWLRLSEPTSKTRALRERLEQR